MNKTITAHTLVKNEEKYLWFSVISIINHVDSVFIWDTGSSDNTIEIIKELKRRFPDKVLFKEVGEVSVENYPKVREEMLKETKTDWFLLVDGDEVWWEDSIKEVVSIINDKGDRLDSIANRYTNLIGDIYHVQNDAAGKYKIDDQSGFLTIRAMNRSIEGLNVSRPHGQQGYFDIYGTLIQERDKRRRVFINNPVCLHFTNLPRSSNGDGKVPKRKMKYKYELGEDLPLDFYYPEAFFRPRPQKVESPWVRRNIKYQLRASIETPLKLLKRKYYKNKTSGY